MDKRRTLVADRKPLVGKGFEHASPKQRDGGGLEERVNLTAAVPRRLHIALAHLSEELGLKKQHMVTEAVDYLVENPAFFLQRIAERWASPEAAQADLDEVRKHT